MRPPVHTITHQSDAALSAASAGTWRLHAGCAVTLAPRGEGGELRVSSGGLWATFDGPHGCMPWDNGDLILRAGDRLRVAAGQRLVIENWDAAAPARFAWEALPRTDNQPHAARSAPPKINARSLEWPAPSPSSMRSAVRRFLTWLRSALPSAATPRQA